MSDWEQPTLFGEGSRPAARKPRQRDDLFEALCLVCKIKPAQLTVSNRGMVNRALKELRAVDATPEQIVNRGQAYVERWRHTPTPGSLTRHWAELAERPQSIPARAQEPLQRVPEERRHEIASKLRSWLADRG